MSGALWAITAGLGFGIFQTLNRQAVRDMDVYVSTFIQLLVSALVLSTISVLTQDISRLFRVSFLTWINFSVAGFFHFLIGWTFLNASHKRIGAARTSSLIGTTPLFGAVVAAITLGEFPTVLTFIGILVIVGGVYLVNSARAARVTPAFASARTVTLSASPGSITGGWRQLWFGLAAALCWSISPIFIRFGLAELPSPILGVTVGISANAFVYAGILAGRRLQTGKWASFTTDAFALKMFAALLVGLSTWARWVALDLTTVGMVLAISLVSVPTVNFLSPLVSGRDLERVTMQVWLGSGLIVGSSLVLIFF